MKPNLDDMHIVLRERYEAFKLAADQLADVPYQVNCVLRTYAEQLALHAQGRMPLADVNAHRKKAGMPWMITEEENKGKVTWTMSSKHFPDGNGKSRAFDVVVLKNGRTPSWDIKWDGDKDNIGDYEELAKMAEMVGLVAGGHWDKPDWPHFQLPDDVA
jgi:hypothetical protein